MNPFSSSLGLYSHANGNLDFGRCCPQTQLCCSYGYCIDSGRTCCPNGSCDPNWLCCGDRCSPRGGDCCIDGNYCEPGNICVRLISNNRIVCCTDLQCTAVVRGGTTSYATTESPRTTRAPPPITTQAFTQDVQIRTYYFTVRW